MQFRKEWVIPTAVGVGSFTTGIFIGTTVALYRVIKGTEGINEYHELFQDKAAAAESKLMEIDSLGQRLERLIEAYERLYENHRRFDGTEQSSDERERGTKEEKSETPGQISLSFDSNESDESSESTTPSTEGVGFAVQSELKKQAVMAHIDSEEEESMVNVFRRPVDEDWDWNEEMEKRKHSAIYIIHRDEYEEEEKAEDGYTQSTVTYYRGDGILCDESDVPIYEAEKVVGKLEFGRGSGDPNVCYVRNENLTSEYEVLLEEGWFGHEVLGQHVQDLIAKSKQTTKLEHSVPKFRPE